MVKNSLHKSEGSEVVHEISELRAWLRDDAKAHTEAIARLHDKIDRFKEDNANAHSKLTAMIAKTEKNSEVKTAVIATKIGIYVTLLTVVVTGVVHAWFGSVI